MGRELFDQLGLALLLGLLVGLQRERTESSVAGIRTFPLIALFGVLCAHLGLRFGEWVVAAGLIAVAGFFIIGNLARLKAGDIDPGLTTEVAGILLYGVGAYLVVGAKAAAVAVGGATALLLQYKQPLHRFVGRLGEQDVKAIMQFVLLTLVILPVLPNRAFGPYAVLNPFKLWLMVVLIVGLSLVGYVLYKVFDARTGTLLGGVLGGLISSTATTVSYARRSRTAPGQAELAALVIVLASATVFIRVLVEIGTVAPGQFYELALPLVAMQAVKMLVAAGAYRWIRHREAGMPPQGNPAELKSALVFGVLYGVVLLATAAAQDLFGARGLYAVAALSGLTDMDAITLSTAQLVAAGRLEVAVGWRAILLASLSNLVFKAGVVAVLGDRALVRRIAVLFGLLLLAGAAILAWWPD